MRIVKNDVSIMNDIESDRIAEIGWKLIKTEAFLPPDNKLVLCAFIGTGMQFLLLSFNIMVLGVLGLYYGHKGSIKTVAILVYSFTGIFNG